jgi:hypothetical protein
MKLGDKLNKVKSGVGGVKARSLVVIMIVILGIVALLIWTALRDTTGSILEVANVKHVKPLQNLPGAGETSVVYDPLQAKQNEAQAAAAKESGQSAIPSLINQGGEGYNRGGFGNLGDNTGRCGDECYDQSGFDAQGFDKNGFDKNGFDRNGYDKDGFDKDGFDRQGYDRDGFNKDGCNRQGFTRDGKPCKAGLFNKDCFNAQGKDKNGCDRQGKDAQGAVCYNEKGFNASGYDKCGLDASGLDANGLDKDGYDKDGYDKNGLDRNGCDKQGKNKEGKACYNAKGFTADGFDKNGHDAHGFGRDGFDKQGFDKNGLNAAGYDRMGFDKDGCNKEGKDRQGRACGKQAEGNDLSNLLTKNTEGEGAPASTQASASAQYERLMADQRALQAQQMAALTSQQQADLAAQQQAAIAAAESLMSNQAQALIAAWAPPTQSYVKGNKKDEKPVAPAGSTQTPGSLPAAGTGPIVQRAGDIVFAIIDTSINSDEPGPVLARVVSGPLKGSKVLGTFERQDKKLMLTFTTLSMPNVPESIDIDAIAIDPETARTALASDVDNHYLTKYGSLMASSFLQGMGQAVQTSIGTPQLSSQNSATVATTTAATTRDQVIVGLGAVGQQIATDINQSNIQPTVTLNAGTGVGLLIMSDLRIEAPPKDAAPTPDFGTTTSGRTATNLAPVSSSTTQTNAQGTGAGGATSTNSTTTNSTTVYNPASGVTSVSPTVTPTAGAPTATTTNISNNHP